MGPRRDTSARLAMALSATGAGGPASRTRGAGNISSAGSTSSAGHTSSAGRPGHTSSTDHACGPIGRPALLERVLEPPAGPVQADLGRRFGDAELGGDGVVGQVVDVAQDDDLPEPDGKVAE